MTTEFPWLNRIVDCVHEQARDPRKEHRYRDMVREWAGGMVKNARPSTIPIREYVKQEYPDCKEEDIKEHLRLYNAGLTDRKPLTKEIDDLFLHDPIAISTNSDTPLNKKYATLAAIHDYSKHCSCLIDPWLGRHWRRELYVPNDGSPPRETISAEEEPEYATAMKYYNLKLVVAEITDDDQSELKKFLDNVSNDLKQHCGEEDTPQTDRPVPERPFDDVTKELGADSSNFPVLDDEDIKILSTLSGSRMLMTLTELEMTTRISRKTIGERVKLLIEQKLLHRPKGPKRGVTITAYGKDCLE